MHFWTQPCWTATCARNCRCWKVQRRVRCTGDNQSGLRDYWAAAMLHGSPPRRRSATPKRRARLADAHAAVHARHPVFLRQSEFPHVCESCSSAPARLRELLRDRVFARAGMTGALLCADTRAMPDGTEGYEGNPTTGFRAAENRILWTGDAGLGACLDDMIAWERHIDATRDDPDALHSRLSAPVSFADGAAAAMASAWGGTEFGRADRPWRRVARLAQQPALRVGACVGGCHVQPQLDAKAHEAALDVLAAMSGRRPAICLTSPICRRRTGLVPMSNRNRVLLCVSTRCREGPRCVCVTAISPEQLDLHADGTPLVAATASGCGPDADGLWMHRSELRIKLTPATYVSGAPAEPDIAGQDVAPELGAEDSRWPMLGARAGRGLSPASWGRGAWETRSIRSDRSVWALPCRRRWTTRRPGTDFRRSGAMRRAGGRRAGWWPAGARAAWTSGSGKVGKKVG